MIYCYPRFSKIDCFYFRLFGPGLGNLLFPWARAVLAARNPRFRLIDPTWPQIKLGRLIRLDPDLRTYTGMFQALETSVTGTQRLFALLRSRRVPEAGLGNAKDGDLVVFEGIDGFFQDLLGSHKIVQQALVQSTRTTCLPQIEPSIGTEIVVHVRLGDFAPAAVADISAGRLNSRIPIEWYVEMVRKIRTALRAEVKVNVFSDGQRNELSALLALPRCELVSYGTAISDLIALSRGGVLVASGSTFSMWASFLGQMPTIWHPGQLRQRVNDDARYEAEIGIGDGISDALTEAMRTALPT